MLDALLLLGPTGQPPATEEAFLTLLSPLALRLKLAPNACLLAFREREALDAIRTFLAAGYRQIVVQSLALEPEEHQHEAIFASLDWIRVQTPQVTIRYTTNLPVVPAMVSALADRVGTALSVDHNISQSETAILLLGRGGYNAENNAEIARIARLLWERRPDGWVETAYYQQTRPGIGEGLLRCHRLGARRIVVAPYLLFWNTSQRHISAQIAAFQAQQPEIPITLAETLADHHHVIEAIAQQAMITTSSQSLRQRHHAHSHGHGHIHSTEGDLNPLLQGPTFLPPRYRNGAAVSAAPMSAAPLVYDAEGKVAWDQIWGNDDPSTGSGQVPNSPFCELALAGGPPHRGELLEPVSPEMVKADWAGYGQVLNELTRGIQLTTGLRTRLSQAPGWIGVECYSEEMALWLLRAIIVENISVRREGSTLFLPAGPAFRLEYEIKNVITALAKTHHYWQEHLHG